ncbi:hypothetical protein BBP40_002582 [Aspergillus hancockii]|nr:hypothetical protein BBP40_002582 [Aspergillus hancockii]
MSRRESEKELVVVSCKLDDVFGREEIVKGIIRVPMGMEGQEVLNRILVLIVLALTRSVMVTGVVDSHWLLFTRLGIAWELFSLQTNSKTASPLGELNVFA